MIVGIDSMILIYAGLVPKAQNAVASETLAELGIRAKLLIRRLADEKAQVVVPVVAITELLVPVPWEQKGAVIAELKKRFICHPLDLPSSAIASDIWARYKQLPQDLQYESRDVLKADAMIVASARAAGATDFYSHDEKCRAMAGLVMDAHDLPTRADDLFSEDEIRKGADI